MIRALLLACAALVAVAVVSGCGTTGLSEAGSGEVSGGKTLFVENCGSCHVLADAGTQGTVGPNLDDAFRQSRADGLGKTTIQSVVFGQISYPVENPVTGVPGMKADIVTGDDAHSVAAYVASVAGLPTQGQPASSAGGGGTETGGGDEDEGGAETGGGETGTSTEAGGGDDGAALFADGGCGTCHTLAAAGSSGTIGPNLDEAQPSQERAVEVITNGSGAMPSFADRFSEDEIAALAQYVAGN